MTWGLDWGLIKAPVSVSKGQNTKASSGWGSQLTTEGRRAGVSGEKPAPRGALMEGGEGRERAILSLTHQAHLQNCPSCCLPVFKRKNDRLINVSDSPLSHKGGDPA